MPESAQSAALTLGRSGRYGPPMQPPALSLSADQAEAFDRLTAAFAGQGIDLAEGTLTPLADGKASVLAVVGKAGSGKTMLLAEVYRA